MAKKILKITIEKEFKDSFFDVKKGDEKVITIEVLYRLSQFDLDLRDITVEIEDVKEKN